MSCFIYKIMYIFMYVNVDLCYWFVCFCVYFIDLSFSRELLSFFYYHEKSIVHKQCIVF